jgi:DNA-binding CsgD family transcriptional regulator/PAS domain-containing protein
MQALQPEILSSVIGEIYECALNSDRWERALTLINRKMNGAYTTISLSTPEFLRPRMVAQSAWDPVMLKILNEEYGVDGIPGLRETIAGDIDTPRSTLDQMSRSDFFATRFYQDWAKPQGLLDGCVVKFVHTSDRVGALAAVTYETRDIISENERRFLAALSPHLRRATMICDLLNFERVQANAFRGALEKLQTPVILVTAESKIVYVNESAQSLLEAGLSIQSLQGNLKPVNLKMSAGLQDAILRCTGNHLELGSRGIGLPLSGEGQTATVAYVLPLENTELRTSFSAAIAAVFIATSISGPPPQQTVLATLYDLTPAEARVMMMAGEGASPSSAALILGVSENTFKTHLSRVYGKTGVTRQVELTNLVASLSPPTFLGG